MCLTVSAVLLSPTVATVRLQGHLMFTCYTCYNTVPLICTSNRLEQQCALDPSPTGLKTARIFYRYSTLGLHNPMLAPITHCGCPPCLLGLECSAAPEHAFCTAELHTVAHELPL